jgi:hypothetical protein
MRHLTIILTFISISAFGQTERTIAKSSIDSLTSISEFIGVGKDTFHYFSIVDKSINQYRLPDNFVKPKKWNDAEKSRTDHEFYGGTYADTFDLQDALATIDTAKNFWTVCAAKSWCLKNYNQAFPFLVTRLTIKTKVGLENMADLIIWERIGSGDLKFYGHGGGMQEDIFTIAGRASWILYELTGEEFAVVHVSMTEVQAKEYKRLWAEYINELKK